MIPFTSSAPPTLFNAALAELVRSIVKFTFEGPAKLCLLQLSITPTGSNDNPQNTNDFLMKSALSMKRVF